jgi:uncharacterized protein Veg
MIEKLRNELNNLKNKEVDIIIDEGRSRKRKEKGIIKEIYNRTFIIEINNMNSSFSFADLINKTIVIKGL